MTEIDPAETIQYGYFKVSMLYYERSLDRCTMKDGCYIWEGASCGGRWAQIGIKAQLPDGTLVSKVISVSKLIWSHDMGHFPAKLQRTCDEILCVNPSHHVEIVKHDKKERLPE